MAIADLFEWTIDFQGQKLADQFTHMIPILFAMVGFVAGYGMESLLVAVEVFAVGVVLTMLLVLPPWPMYNRHPLTWLPASQAKQ